MSVASIDPVTQQLTYAGVGNTEACLIVNARWQRLIAYRGIVGLTLPRLRTFSHTLGSEWTLVMHTDGIRLGFEVDAPPETARENPQAVADGILQRCARSADDAAVVVARPGHAWQSDLS
ncbi:MAG: SpoIIE family protein phosphatase [Chloroflexi bacterium]|nr:SpoIIE family protein phosphatase [Chloroflexota bacterium]